MIYFYEFLKGVGVAFTGFGAWYFTREGLSLVHLCVGAMPGIFITIISFLLIENLELKNAG